jgi:hypothetical protein
MARPLYPRAFLTPECRPVSIKAMGKALSVIRQDPDADYPGWSWFPTQGHHILAEFHRGLNDRINRRAAPCGCH